MKRRAPPDFLEKGRIRPSPSEALTRLMRPLVQTDFRFAQIAAFGQNMGEQDLLRQVDRCHRDQGGTGFARRRTQVSTRRPIHQQFET
jgi:hypothetical protein